MSRALTEDGHGEDRHHDRLAHSRHDGEAHRCHPGLLNKLEVQLEAAAPAAFKAAPDSELAHMRASISGRGARAAS